MFDRRLLDYIGDISQVGGIKRYEFVSGKAKGLDICNLSYKNIPVAFISKTGIVSQYFYNDRDFEILRSFTGGFLTTCGLTQVGEPCEFEGGHYELHGYYSNIPAEDVIIYQEWEDNAFQMKISGKVRQSKLLHEDMVLSRTISAELGLDRISITDRVNFTQWKYLGKKDYVMGMEPCNNLVQGLKYESDNGTLEYLKPGEERVIRLDIHMCVSVLLYVQIFNQPAVYRIQQSFISQVPYRANILNLP